MQKYIFNHNGVTIMTSFFQKKFQPDVVCYHNFLQSFITTHSNKERLKFLLKIKFITKRSLLQLNL